jgi:hypothetical protein
LQQVVRVEVIVHQILVEIVAEVALEVLEQRHWQYLLEQMESPLGQEQQTLIGLVVHPQYQTTEETQFLHLLLLQEAALEQVHQRQALLEGLAERVGVETLVVLALEVKEIMELTKVVAEAVLEVQELEVQETAAMAQHPQLQDLQ